MGYLITTVLCQFYILKKFVCIILESTLKVEAFLDLFVPSYEAMVVHWEIMRDK